jgi:hypothetical protein
VCDAQEHVLAGSVVTHALGPVPPAAGTGAAAGIAQAAVMDFVPGKPFSTDNYLSATLDSVCDCDGLAELGQRRIWRRLAHGP